MEKILFTSESVSEGHPDKVCDKISDAILDACLKVDSNARVACECYISGNFLVIGGEITCKQKVDYKSIAKNVLKEIGYDSKELGTNYKTIKIKEIISTQSPDISMGVSQIKSEDIGAGDQGMMFGYASKETEGYMPLAIVIAHKLVRYASELRHLGKFPHARPDMKSQVTIDYSNPKNLRIDNILMSCQHDDNIDLDEFKKFIHDNIMLKVVRDFKMNEDFDYRINPTGRFVVGGPAGDTGLTGRKIIVDTYGGYAPHGGGAFSGKDPTKVDRSGAYMARYIAKNLVAAGVADRLEVQIAYAIGVNKPVSIAIKTFKTSKYNNDVILKAINEIFDLRPGMIIKNFSLRNPSFRYQDVTNYGHFGRNDLNLPWEKLDKVTQIKKFLSSY